MSPEERAAIRESRQKLAEQITQNEERYKTEIAAQKELLRAYDLVLDHAQTNGQASLVEEPNLRRYRIFAQPGYGYNTKVVRQAIEVLAPRDPFTIKRIQGILAEQGIGLSIQAVTTVITRLREENEIVIRHVGKGRRPTSFIKA